MTEREAPSGVLLIDKPQGITSFDVIRRLRRVTGQRKLGHAGTLDPMATGLLLILVNQATRLSDHLMHAPKRYEATLAFGASTDTDDADGQVTALAPWDHITLPAIQAAAAALTGDILQRPPAYSALHVDGQRAYDLARRGRAPDLPPRPVRVDAINDLALSLPPPDAPSGALPTLRLSVRCGPGTYIRSLARDLGLALGSLAHLTALRRTHTARCDLACALTLDQLEADPSRFPACMTPMWDALAHLPDLPLTPAQAQALSRGQAVESLSTLTPATYRVPIPGGGGLLALVEVNERGAKPTTRVFSPAWSPGG